MSFTTQMLHYGQGHCRTAPLDGCDRKIGRLYFYEEFDNFIVVIYPPQTPRQLLYQPRQLTEALIHTQKILRKSGFRAQRFASAPHCNRPLINTAAELVEPRSHLTKTLHQLKHRKLLQVIAGDYPQLRQTRSRGLTYTVNFFNR